MKKEKQTEIKETEKSPKPNSYFEIYHEIIYIKPRRWRALLIVLFLSTISIILTALFLYKYFTPSFALYNQNCDYKFCSPNLGLKCEKGFCDCIDTQYYIKGCHEKKTFLQKCSSQSDICTSNLECLNGICMCDSLSYWNGDVCLLKKSYKQACQKSNIECLKDSFLYCNLTMKNCICEENR